MRNIETEELADIYAKYPAHPEEPMSDSQQHYNAITRLGENLLMLYADRRDDVGVFCNMAWYPTEASDNRAPDVMVVFGVPQDRTPPRQSFAQPLEGVGPSVVFELSSNSNRYGDIEAKKIWYQEHGVQEYYWIDETRDRVDVFIRAGDELVEQTDRTNWTSELLGIRLTWSPLGVRVYLPDGLLMRPVHQVALDYRRYAEQTQEELEEEAEARQAAEQRAEQEAQRAEQNGAMLEQERQRVQRLLEFLREQGIEPPSE